MWYLFGHVTVSVTGLWSVKLKRRKAVSGVVVSHGLKEEKQNVTLKVEVMRGGCHVSSFNTTNLVCHLKKRHPDVHNQW